MLNLGGKFMKKVILNSIFAICIVVSFTSCKEDDTSTRANSRDKDKTDCLTGKWEYNSEILTFESKTKGQLNCSDTIYDFTYKTENNKIIFSYNKKTAKDNDEENEIDRSDTLSYSCKCPTLTIDNKEWNRTGLCNGEKPSDGGDNGGGSGGGGGGISDEPAFAGKAEYLGGPGKPGTPPGYGVLMVYFFELCEKVSVSVDDMYGNSYYIGDISKTVNQDPPYNTPNSESCRSGLLETGYYTITLKVGKKTYKGSEAFKIEQDYCIRIGGLLPCKK